MIDYKLDAKTAEMVMGFVPLQDFPSQAWRTQDNEVRTTDVTSFNRFSPSVDCNSDYEVLKHVRETWTLEQVKDFHRELSKLWEQESEWPGSYMAYKPGDYSRSALNVVEDI